MGVLITQQQTTGSFNYLKYTRDSLICQIIQLEKEKRETDTMENNERERDEFD